MVGSPQQATKRKPQSGSAREIHFGIAIQAYTLALCTPGGMEDHAAKIPEATPTSANPDLSISDANSAGDGNF